MCFCVVKTCLHLRVFFAAKRPKSEDSDDGYEREEDAGQV